MQSTRPLLKLRRPLSKHTFSPILSFHITHHAPYSNHATTSPPQTIFSGIQPTGIPHIGNYLGALQNWVSLQDNAARDTKLLYSIVDLHAITVPQDPETLRACKRISLAMLMAVGLDPKRSVLFFQSSVSAHSELMWILSCTASMGYLSRMTQWKSKLSLDDNVSPLDERSKSKLKLGLFSYPVLQAADILVHRATHVPVGEDQSQHLEFARECVTNFNHAYGPHLVEPNTILSPAKRIMSLTTPTQKMSKSATNPLSRILITDTPLEIRQKIMGAVTDSKNAVTYDPERLGVFNLLNLWSYCDSGKRSAETLAGSIEGQGLKVLKERCIESVTERLGGVREKFERVMGEDGGRYLDFVAKEGGRRARESAEETMVLVREAVGF